MEITFCGLPVICHFGMWKDSEQKQHTETQKRLVFMQIIGHFSDWSMESDYLFN